MRMNKEELVTEVEWRRKHGDAIRSEVDSYAERNFGVRDFSQKADRFFGNGTGLKICLARQVPTVNIEQVALEISCAALDAELGFPVSALSLSYLRDSYSGRNEYKRSLISQPIIGRRKRERAGEIFVQRKNLVPRGVAIKDGMLFDQIQTISGILPEFHLQQRRDAFGTFQQADISEFFAVCLRESIASGVCQRRMPGHVYEEMGGVDRKIPLARMNGGRIRPPADWFYHLHFLLLVDGHRALASTVDDCCKIDRIISNVINDIVEEVGVAPLIIDTPDAVETDGHRSGLIEVNPAVFKSGWKQQMSIIATDDLFSLFEGIEREVIRLE